MGFDWHNLEVLTLQPRHVADQIWIETWHHLADIWMMLEVFWALKNVHTPLKKRPFRCQDVFQWRVNVPKIAMDYETPSISFFGDFHWVEKPWELSHHGSVLGYISSQDPHQEGAQQHAKSKSPKYWVGFGGRATSHGLWIWFSIDVNPREFGW